LTTHSHPRASSCLVSPRYEEDIAIAVVAPDAEAAFESSRGVEVAAIADEQGIVRLEVSGVIHRNDKGGLAATIQLQDEGVSRAVGIDVKWSHVEPAPRCCIEYHLALRGDGKAIDSVLIEAVADPALPKEVAA